MSKKKQNIRRILAIGMVASLVTSIGASETVATIAQTLNNESSVVEKQNETEVKSEEIETLQSTVKPDAALTETFECVTKKEGTTNVVTDGYLHIKSGANNQNNAGNTAEKASAIFKSTSQKTLDFSKSGYIEFDFKSPSEGTKNRFGVFLGHKEFRKGLFIGFNSTGWFWQKYADTEPYGTISASNVPAANTEYHLKLEWDGTNVTVLLNNKELGKVEYSAFIPNMNTGEFAFSCGTYGTEYTDMYIRNLHYSAQEDITAYDISGTVKDQSNKTLAGVNVKIDNKIVATTNDSGKYTITGLLPKEYILTFEKDGYQNATKTVTIINADMTAQDIQLDEIVVEKYTLKTSAMTVEVDQNFPRVIKYTVDGKTINGQTSVIDQIVINNKTIKPQVTSKVEGTKAVYTMTCEADGVNAVITAELRADKNNLTFEITNVENKMADKDTNPVQTIDIPNHSLVSVNSSNQNAKYAAANVDGNTRGNGDVFADVTKDISAGKTNYFYAFVSNGDLSAGIDSNSEFGTSGSGADNKRVAVTTQDKGGEKHVGLSSSTWYYDRKATTKITDKLTDYTKVIPHLENPKVTVSITADRNGDETADWQDAAIALRDVMHNPYGYEEVPELVSYRIAMNFGSQAQNPFLKTLDNVKKIASHTDGLGQSILLKGYGNEGHDSGHPDYADIGQRIGGVEDMITMMDDGAKLGARFGIHVNASEMYTEAKAFSEELARRNSNGGLNYGWTWLDQGIGINGLYDLMSGGRTQRFNELEKKVGDKLNFVYVDVWGNNQSGAEDAWETRRLTNDIVSNGWRIAHEWGYANEYDSTFQHWAADLTYGGSTMKGINSRIIRFLRNHQKDSWVADYPSYGGHANAPLLGGYNMKDFEGWQGRNDYDSYVTNLYNQNISTKFIQHFTVTNWELGRETTLPTGEKFQTDKSVTLQGDLGKLEITRGSDEYSTDLNSQYRYREMRLNGKVVLKGHVTPGNTIDGVDETYLLPWVWDADTGEKVQESKEKLYHWNTKGGQTTWELPDNWKNLSTVKVYKITDTGRTDEKEVKVVNGEITLDAQAQIPYVVARGAESAPNIVWSVGTGMVDVGFNSGKLDQYQKTGTGTAVIEKTEASNPVLKLDGNVQMTQEITGLQAGQKYAFYVAVDNRSDSKATVTIKDGSNTLATNYTMRSIAKNYVKADAHSTNSPTVDRTSYFQNMYVYFTAPQSGKVTVTLGKEAGDGSAYFDDLRVVKNTGIDNFEYKDGKLVKYTQDFEDNVQGIYPFVMSDIQGVEDNRPHLSEKNGVFTQKGWDVKKLDDVITDSKVPGVATGDDANWSLKTMGLTSSNKMLYHTIPQNFRFEPGVTYNISFDYQSGSNGTYAIAYGSGEYHTSNFTQIPLKATLPSDAKPNNKVSSTERVTFTMVGDESGDSWFGIYSTNVAPDYQGTVNKEQNFGGYADIVIDNVVIEVSEVQKGELLKTINEAKGKYEEDYPAEQYTALQNALAEAEKVSNNLDATAQDVKTATDNLRKAIDSLTPYTTMVTGVIKNADNKPLKDAKVILTTDKGERIELVTDENGVYKTDKIFVRTYNIKVEAKGYETIYAETVETQKDQTVTKDLQLAYKVMPDYLNEFTSDDTSYLEDLEGIGGSNSKTISDGKLNITFSGGSNSFGRNTGVTVDTNAPTMKNGTVEFDVTPAGSPNRFGVALRAKNMNDYIYIGVGDKSNQYFAEFWNEKGNAWTNMYEGPTMQAGKITHFKAKINEGKVSLWIDGIEVIKELQLDNKVQLTAGQVGFECRNGGAKFAIDNLEVTSDDVVADTNTVSGIITENGQPVYNVELELVPKNVRATANYKALTNVKGEYTFKNVPYGDYTMNVVTAGYQDIAIPVNVNASNPTVNATVDLKVDKTILEAKVAEIEKLNKNDYTPESFAELEKALTNAKNILNSVTATAQQVRDAVTALDIAVKGLVPAETQAVDKTALKSLIDEVSQLDKTKYTAESFAKLETALANANKVYADVNATQNDVNNALNALQSARDGLVLNNPTQTDKSVLENLVKELSMLDKSKYTADSFAKLQSALDNARSVLANANATQAQINDAVARLQQAKAGLVAIGGSNNSNSNNSPIATTGDNTNGFATGALATALAGFMATVLSVFKRRRNK